MLTQETVDRIRRFDGAGLPVLSLYLDLGVDPKQRQTTETRIKSLLKPLEERVEGGDLSREARLSLREDFRRMVELGRERARDPGRAFAAFLCHGRGFAEALTLPGKVWDRVVVDATPYVRPMLAVLDEYHRFLAVVVDRRHLWIYEFYMGELQALEQEVSEGVRKKNFAGFYGYEEHRVRHHAEELAHRHYRRSVELVREHYAARGAHLLFLGGQKEVVDEFEPFLPQALQERVAGRFSIDPHTMTPAKVLEACTRLEEEYERGEEVSLVRRIEELAGAGGRATLGLGPTLEAGNLRAIELLAIDRDYAHPGVVCDRCAWFAVEAESCGWCQGPTRATDDVVDELAEGVVDASGRIEHVFAETSLRRHKLGALLRFRL